MNIIQCEQGSESWLLARLGIPTASNFSKIMSKGKGKTRHTYMLELLDQSLTGQATDGFKSEAMEWGNDYEEQAAFFYEFEKNVTVEKVGFCTLDDRIGASPDRLVNDDGLLEIKCPNTKTHLDTILEGKMPSKHKAQVQGQLWVTEREWCDFVSYDPRIPSDNCIFIDRIYPDLEYIKELSKEVHRFIEEMNGLMSILGED